MESAEQVQERVIAAILGSGDCFSQYTYLLQRSTMLDEMSEDEIARATLVDGCQSRVWLLSEFDGEVMRYRSTSDTLLVKGLLSILMEIYSGRTPADVISTNVRFLQVTELGETLETARIDGVAAIKRDITVAAREHLV